MQIERSMDPRIHETKYLWVHEYTVSTIRGAYSFQIYEGASVEWTVISLYNYINYDDYPILDRYMHPFCE